MHKVILVSLAAALISVRMTGVAQAAYTERDVDRMEDLINEGNWVDLRIFLLANPRVLNGVDPFTQQLRKFLEETDSLYTALTFDPSVFPTITIAAPTQPPAPTPARPRPVRQSEDSRAAIAQNAPRPSANAAQSIY